MPKFIIPVWPAPPQVKAYTTTRNSGSSISHYTGFNLADHVGDDSVAVAANRSKLMETLQLPSEPIWLKQVHSIKITTASHVDINCDASYATEYGQVCVVLTADCLPVLFCDRAGKKVAAAHAGWRGLANGILEATVRELNVPTQELLVWLGPAIGPKVFEVGNEVRKAFINFLPQAVEAFKPSPDGRWLANLYLLARQRFAHQGITAVYGGDFCTYTDTKNFYSYRRNKITGRMATLIWLKHQ